MDKVNNKYDYDLVKIEYFVEFLCNRDIEIVK